MRAMAAAQPGQRREVRFVEALGDRGRLLEERERRRRIALAEHPERLRHQEIAAHDAVDPVSSTTRPREQASRRRRPCRLGSSASSRARTRGAPRIRVAGAEGDLMCAVISAVAASSSPLRCAASPAWPRSVAPSGAARSAAGTPCGFAPRAAGEGGAGLVQVGRGRHGQFGSAATLPRRPPELQPAAPPEDSDQARTARWPSAPGSRRTTARCPRRGSGRSCRRCWR